MTINLEEIRKLATLYKLKLEIRYAHIRDEDKVYDTESVAEHVYGMMLVADYFLPLLDPDRTWDRDKIHSMILYHDMDEIETGDTVGWMKTTEHRSVEIEAVRRVILDTPKHMQRAITDLMDEYFLQESTESHFVKAVDKFEPLIHLWNDSGKETTRGLNATLEKHWSIKRGIIDKFPLMQEYAEAITAEWETLGYFAEPEDSIDGAA